MNEPPEYEPFHAEPFYQWNIDNVLKSAAWKVRDIEERDNWMQMGIVCSEAGTSISFNAARGMWEGRVVAPSVVTDRYQCLTMNDEAHSLLSLVFKLRCKLQNASRELEQLDQLLNLNS